MIKAEGLALEKVRCAEVHAAEQVDPAGTAPTWDAVLAVEIPAPWPRDISACEPFASLIAEPAPTIEGPDGRAWRPQGLVRDPAADWTRVIAFEREVVGAGPFHRREWRLPAAEPERLVELATALLEADADAIAEAGEWRDDPPSDTVDLLLCTHGTRDVCCGSTGTALYGQLVEALGGASAHARGHQRRVWRTSHAGGHRFAPTALSFPHGVSWAHLGVDECTSILDRSGDPRALGAHMRGSLSFEGGVEQVADREGFVSGGWNWLDRDRTAVLVAHDRSELRSTVDVMASPADAAGTGCSVSVEVVLDRHIPMPTCGEIGDPEFRTEPVWKVLASQVRSA